MLSTFMFDYFTIIFHFLVCDTFCRLDLAENSENGATEQNQGEGEQIKMAGAETFVLDSFL